MGILAKHHRALVGQAIIEIFIISLIIETGQLFFSIGLFEICDLVDNTIGGILGIIIVMVIDRRRKMNSKRESLSQKNILFLNLLVASLNGSEIVVDSEDDQAVIGIVFDTLLAACIAKNSDYYRFIAYKMKMDYVFKENLKTQQELIEELIAAGYHPVIIKGYATAIYYRNPLTRTIGDIDFIVPKDEFTEVVNYLLQHNCRYRDKNHMTPNHHIPLIKNNVIIEPHSEVAGIADIKKKNYVRSLIEKSMDASNVIKLEESNFLALDDISNGLIILLHARSHMNNGIGFRQLIDWVMFVEKHINDSQFDLIWKEIFEKSGLLSFAKAITSLCCRYLCLKENYSWCEGEDSHYSSQLLEYVFEQGNFGHKIVDARMSRAFTKADGFGGYLHRIIDSGYGVIKCHNKGFLAIEFIAGVFHNISVFFKSGGIKKYLNSRKKFRPLRYLGMYE